MNPLVLGVVFILLVIVGIAVALVGFTFYTVRKVQSFLPPHGRFIDAAGVRFHVHEQGEGPDLLLIHGLAGQMRHFTYDVAGRLADDFHVVSIDRPGSGYSVRREATAADVSTQAAAIAALIETLKLERPVVVGHSLGGAVALTLALEHPQHVRGLVLLAPLTHLPEQGEIPAAFRALTISSGWSRRLFAWTLAVPAAIAGRRAVLGQVFGPDPVPGDFAVRGGGLLGVRPSHFIAACRDLQALPGRMPAIMSRYAELRLPVHVLFGRGDRILDWQVNGQALIDKVPGATLAVREGGHMLPVTQPQQTADFIRAKAVQIRAGTMSDDAAALPHADHSH